MLEVTKYLPICFILVSSSNIEASKSHEDCDYGDCGQTGYFASGSAYSSQVLMPDGSVVTNSKGSSISSDGIQRSFHELKREADQYVSNSEPKTTYISRNEYANGVPIFKISRNQGMTDLPFIPLSSQSESRRPIFQQLPEQQKPLSNAYINANSFFNQMPPSVHDGYQNDLPQEPENVRGLGNVNSVPNSNQPPFIYYPPFPLEVPQELLDSNAEKDNKLGSPPADANESASLFQQKIRSYWRRMQDANANIPLHLLSPKANTFTMNGINLAYKNDEVNGFIPDLIPPANIKETHYIRENSAKNQLLEQNVNQYTPPAPSKIPHHVKITGDEKKSKSEQNLPYIGAQDRFSKISGSSLGNDVRRTKLVVKAKSTSEPVDSSQPLRREINLQTSKSNTPSLTPKIDSETPVQSVPAGLDIPQNDAVATEPEDYLYVPLQSNVQMSSSNDQAKSGNKNGHGPVEPTYHLNLPILLRGVPQNIRIAYPNPNSESSINQIYEPATSSSPNSDGVSDSASNSLVPDNVTPQNVDKPSSSSSNLHYFITNGYVGEQLVPNSDIYVPSDAVIRRNPQFVNNYAYLNSAASTSPDTPQKSSYEFSTTFSSQSRDLNGKKTENRAASVTVNNNGKIDSYHVRS